MGRMVSISIWVWVVCLACQIASIIAFTLIFLFGGVILDEPNYIILGVEFIGVSYSILGLVNAVKRLKSGES